MSDGGIAAEPDCRQILLQLIAGMGLCDHMGDVAEDVQRALELAGVDVGEWDDLPDLGRRLGRTGVTTLWGTSLVDD